MKHKKQKMTLFTAMMMLSLVSCTETSSTILSGNSSYTPISSTNAINPHNIEVLISALNQEEVAVQGTFKLSFYQAGTETLINSVTTKNSIAIGPDYYYNSTEEDGVLDYSEYYRTAEGYVSERSLLPTNQVRETIYIDKDNNPYSYDEVFYNFLAFIDADECEMGEDENHVLVTGLNDTDKKEIVYGLTYYSDIPLDTLEFVYDKDENSWSGKLTGSDEGVPVETEAGNITIDMKCEMEFDLTTPSAIGFNPVAPIPTKAENAPLQELFTKLQAGNYTLDIKRTGGIDQGGSPQKWYINDKGIIRTSLADDGSVKSGYGYYDTGAGLDHVTYNQGELVGSETLDTKTTLEDLKTPFLFAAEAFDLTDENTYVLKSGYGFEDYIALTLPDATASWNQQYYINIDDGSLNVTLNDDGSATFFYSYTYLDYGNEVKGTITTTVSAINSTTLPFTYTPYEAPDLTNWSGYGDVATELLELYLGSDIDKLPFLDPTTAKTYKASEINNYNGHLLNITNSYSDTATALSTYEAYVAELEEMGWVRDEKYTDSTGRYMLDDGNGGYYHIAVTSSSTYIYLKVYQPTISLSDWYHRSFDDQYACWMTYTTNVKTYADETGTGDPTSNTTETNIQKFKDGAMQVTENGKQTTVFYEDVTNNRFTILGKNSDNTWAPITYYDLDTVNLTNYQNGGYVTAPSLMNYVDSYFTEAEGDGSYTLNPAVTSAIAKALFDVTVSAEATGSLQMDFYDNGITLTITDSVVNEGILTETTLSLKIDHIGHQVSFTVPQFEYAE